MVDLSFQSALDKFNSLPKSVQEALIGASSGWIAGYSVVKFGRYAGFSMGASLIILELGHHYGYINIDWKNLTRDLKKAKKEVEKKANNQIPDITRKVQEYAKDNAVMASTFVGGLLLGASSA